MVADSKTSLNVLCPQWPSPLIEFIEFPTARLITQSCRGSFLYLLKHRPLELSVSGPLSVVQVLLCMLSHLPPSLPVLCYICGNSERQMHLRAIANKNGNQQLAWIVLLSCNLIFTDWNNAQFA